MNVCIFCSANTISDTYAEPALDLVTRLAAAGHTLIWGGLNTGFMKQVADSMQQNNGNIISVTTKQFLSHARGNVNETIVVKDLAQRKSVMLARADAVIAMPGGIGTLDEITEALDLKKEGAYEGNVVILNTAGFYAGLLEQLRHIADEGFLPTQAIDGIEVRPLRSLSTLPTHRNKPYSYSRGSFIPTRSFQAACS